VSAHACPQHQTLLIGGPVLFECEDGGGHAVYAADINREFRPEAMSS